MYKNWKLLKSELEDKREEYFQVAEWCNQGKEYTITEKEDYFEVEKIPEPSIEEKSKRKREERDYLLTTVVDPVVTNPLRWGELSEAQQSKYQAYRLYLLGIPQQGDFPDVEIKSFEEFLE